MRYPPFRRARKKPFLGLTLNHHLKWWLLTSEFSFDISTTTMRKQILESIQEKVDIYNEEIVRLTSEINSCQKEFDSCLNTKDIPLEALLVVRQEMEDARDADQRISEIDTELQELSEQLVHHKINN